MTSTQIQWTMKLSDAKLIVDALQQVAESAEGQANYLESDKYAEMQQRDEFMKNPEGSRPKDSWQLSDHDKKRIVEQRAIATRLRELIQS